MIAGRHWLARDLARNGTLCFSEPEATSINRAVGFDKVRVDIYFAIRRSLLESTGPIHGDIIWNMDESSLTVVYKPGRSVAEIIRYRLKSVENGESGDYNIQYESRGRYLTSFMIYPCLHVCVYVCVRVHVCARVCVYVYVNVCYVRTCLCTRLMC